MLKRLLSQPFICFSFWKFPHLIIQIFIQNATSKVSTSHPLPSRRPTTPEPWRTRKQRQETRSQARVLPQIWGKVLFFYHWKEIVVTNVYFLKVYLEKSRRERVRQHMGARMESERGPAWWGEEDARRQRVIQGNYSTSTGETHEYGLGNRLSFYFCYDDLWQWLKFFVCFLKVFLCVAFCLCSVCFYMCVLFNVNKVGHTINRIEICWFLKGSFQIIKEQ